MSVDIHIYVTNINNYVNLLSMDLHVLDFDSYKYNNNKLLYYCDNDRNYKKNFLEHEKNIYLYTECHCNLFEQKNQKYKEVLINLNYLPINNNVIKVCIENYKIIKSNLHCDNHNKSSTNIEKLETFLNENKGKLLSLQCI